MNPLYVCLLLVIIGAVMYAAASAAKKKRGSNEKYQKILTDFYNQVNNMLEEGEALEAYCGYFPCAAVTNRRLLIGDKKGIQTVPFSQIRKVKGMSYSAQKTMNPNQMAAFEIKADKKYTLGNQSDGFARVVEALKHHLSSL